MMTEIFKGKFVIPCCSEAELALRRAEQKGFIKYIPGEEAFRVLEEGKAHQGTGLGPELCARKGSNEIRDTGSSTPSTLASSDSSK